jgi:hypothetical protein
VSVLLGNGNGTFRPAVHYTADPRANAVAVAAGDFTANGIPDIVTVNAKVTRYSHVFSYSVLMGNGDGTFRAAVTNTLPNAPSSLATGVFTSNGNLSIAVGTKGGVMVLLGNGDGTFQAPVFYAADPKSIVSSVVVSDLAGTGKVDLATANSQNNSVSVLLGNGNGAFGPATNYAVGGQGPRTVAAGRLQPNGPLDLVTNDLGSNSVSVLPGAGNGTFGNASQYFAADSPSAVAMGDFAGRGIDDIVVTNSPQGALGMGAVSVLLNRSNGTFAPLPIQATGDYNEGIATGDFRGNGIQDLVMTTELFDTVSVFLGNGDGTFGAPHTFPAGSGGPLDVIVGDFNGDGHLDLLVTEASGSTFADLLMGNGDGTFQAPIQVPLCAANLGITVGHLHNPNILDLVLTDYQNNRIEVMLGNGDGTFQAPVSYAVGQGPTSVAVGDLRGNGVNDLVVTNADDNTVSVLLGNGNGTFQPAVNYSMSNNTQVANDPRSVTLGSLRSKGPLDIVMTNYGTSNVTVLLGNGNGTFGAPMHFAAGMNTSDAVVIADFDGNGTADLLVNNEQADVVTLLPGNGDGTFRAPIQLATGKTPFAMTVGNFDTHNLPEVAVLGAAQTISVLLNDSGGAVPAKSASVRTGSANPSGAPPRHRLHQPPHYRLNHEAPTGDVRRPAGVSQSSTGTGLHVVASPFISNSSLSAAAAITVNDIWAVGDIQTGSTTEQTLAEHFDGASWSVVPTPSFSNAVFNGVAGAARNDVWAVGSVNPFESSAKSLIEHWNGTTWSVVSSPKLANGGSLTGVTAPASDNVWAVGFTPTGALVEHWNGMVWSIVSSSAFAGAGGISAVSADSSTDVWAVAGATSLHWDGQTWSQIPMARLRFGGVVAVSALSPTNVWAVGTGPGVPTGGFSAHPTAVIEHWDGTRWSVVPSPNPNPQGNNSLVAVAAVSANDIWAVGHQLEGPFTEQWDGNKWSIVNTPSGVANLIGMTALSDGTVVAVGQGTNGSAVILHN